MTPADLQLVTAARAGDRTAFEKLCLHLETPLRLMTKRLARDTAEGEDIAQEVFLKAWLKLPDLKNPAAFFTWFWTLARRVGISQITRFSGRKRQPTISPKSQLSQPSCEASPDEQCQGAEQRAELHRFLTMLSAAHRRALVAFYFEGRSLEEMRLEFRTSIGTVKSRLHLARKRLAYLVAPPPKKTAHP